MNFLNYSLAGSPKKVGGVGKVGVVGEESVDKASREGSITDIAYYRCPH